MPEWLAIIVLGVVEGVTEFLPVSSTGHLILAQQLKIGLPPQSDLFNVVIQVGAVMAVMLIFTQRLKQLVFHWREPKNQDYLLKFFASFFVTAAGGLVLEKLGFELPDEAGPVAWAFLVGGVGILVVERCVRGRPLREEITWTTALAIGVAQLVAAVFPGTSRSGITILTGLALGTSRPAATEFSFLLGIPTLLAAAALKILGEIRNPSGAATDWSWVVLGSIAAAVTAFATVRWLLCFVRVHTFNGFGWYRIAVGAAILLFAGG